jgi:chromosome segregation ATPase
MISKDQQVLSSELVLTNRELQ